jgi:hypothetical protein
MTRVATLVLACVLCSATLLTVCDSPASDTVRAAPAQPPATGTCDPSYPTVCIPPYLPDLDCGDIGHKRFQVLPPDPHGFDRDGDGIGCES